MYFLHVSYGGQLNIIRFHVQLKIDDDDDDNDDRIVLLIVILKCSSTSFKDTLYNTTLFSTSSFHLNYS